MFQDAFYTNEIISSVKSELARQKTTKPASIFVVKTNWIDQTLFEIEWDAIIFVDQNPEIQIERLVNFGFDQFTAEQYIDMQFQNVLRAYELSDIIVDDLSNIVSVLDAI